MNKSIVLIIGIIMFSSFVLAAFPPDNILKPAWNNILSLWGESVDEEIVPGMFGYTLKGWEVNTCSQHVTGDLSYKSPGGFSGISTDLSKLYDTAATIQAMKTVYDDNQYLIEVAWYIQPKVDAEYTVYLLKGTDKLTILPNRAVDPVQGETGYIADYYDVSYEYAILAYKSGQEILKTAIVTLNE